MSCHREHRATRPGLRPDRLPRRRSPRGHYVSHRRWPARHQAPRGRRGLRRAARGGLAWRASTPRSSTTRSPDMSTQPDWNAKTIAEFRANEGRVGGNFEGAPLVLLHHRGRTSGREYVTPMMYLPHDTEPDWYHNVTAAGDGSVERGTETYKVTVRELTGAERDRIYAEQARRYPGFAEYARHTAGVRTIPVLEFRRA